MLRGVKCIIEYIVSVVRVSCIVLFALFLPRLCLFYAQHTNKQCDANEFKLGLENISDEILNTLIDSDVDQSRVALVTNQTGKDQAGNRNIDVLRERGFNVVKILTPHHGFYGDCKAGRAQDGVDPQTGICMVSMYGKKGARKLSGQMLDDVDVLVFDLQDAGMRHYGYITTLLEVLIAAAKYNKPIVVLDRPNLLGSTMEGSLIASNRDANLPNVPVPVRHGMTIGELACFCNQHVLKKAANLCVVPMKNYTRCAQIYRPLLSHLSPNITSINSCYGYSFLGLLGEVAPFDIGVGTDHAFQCVLLPESISFAKEKWYNLRVKLKSCGVESSMYSDYSPQKKQQCHGLKLFIRDINDFSSFKTLLVILQFFQKAGVGLTFSSNFDLAVGNSHVRKFVQGMLKDKDFATMVNQELSLFFQKAHDSFLYSPYPHMLRV